MYDMVKVFFGWGVFILTPAEKVDLTIRVMGFVILSGYTLRRWWIMENKKDKYNGDD